MNDMEKLLPGHFISQSPDESQRTEYYAYVKHHLKWLKRDIEYGKICGYDLASMEANLRHDRSQFNQ